MTNGKGNGRLGFAFLKVYEDFPFCFPNAIKSKLWSGGAFVEDDSPTRVARVCARNGPSMNLFSSTLNFTRRDNTTKSEKPRAVLFSGFLAAFLSVSGVQTSISGSFDTLKNEKAPLAPVCQEQLGVQAIIADSSLEIVNADGKESKEMSKECEQKKKIKETLEGEMASPKEDSIFVEAEKQKEEAYLKKVEELETLLEGHPLAKMSSEIAKQDPEIAALIVGIARKESQWGLRSPKKNGDCFNYWGFKGSAGRGTGMGYACFATREEAVEKIAKRLEKLVDKRGTSKPSALVTPWKCGNSCATHSPESVRKWVSDVNQYYTKVLAMK